MTAHPLPAPRPAADDQGEARLNLAQLDRLARLLLFPEPCDVSGVLASIGLGGHSVWFGWTCSSCVLDSGLVVSVDEAEYLAGVHDHTHHGGNPTAVVSLTVKGPHE